MNDSRKVLEEKHKGMGQDMALTTYENLRKLMESEHRVIGLAWYAVVDEIAPDKQSVANQQHGGCVNLVQVSAHYMDHAGRQGVHAYAELSGRVAELEETNDRLNKALTEQLGKLENRSALATELLEKINAGTPQTETQQENEKLLEVRP